MARGIGIVLLVGLTACDGRRDDGGDGVTNAGAGPGDAAGLDLDAGTSVDASPPRCMAPPEPYGTSLGRRLRPFELQQCDGTPYAFYNEHWCDPATRLTVINIAAEWCGPCREESRSLTARITEPYRSRGVRVIQILVQDAEYGPPDLALCRRWVETFGLTNIELIDPEQRTQIYFPGNSLPATIIVDHEGIIQFRENGASEGLVTLQAALDRLLSS
ncbi:MAG: TlpA family protein disulfide reductase [Myxococcota bacterium]|nr:TlpA family protein disulfide reductase [Myxococcota bacterium]